MTDVHAVFVKLSTMKYSDQLVWFLNGFWADCKGEKAEMFYQAYRKFVELDKQSDKKKGEAGNELDHFWAAVLLEKFDTALTATARKEALREMDQDQNGNMSLIEYLTWKTGVDIKAVAEAPQGDNQEALKKAQAEMDAIMAQVEELQKVIARLEEEKAKLPELKAALEKAIAELKAEQDAYNKKCADLQAKIDNPSTSGMQKAKASNELAQLQSEDPLPLRRAKITQEAALRKVQKQEKTIQGVIDENNAKLAQLEESLVAVQETLARLKKQGGEGGKGAIFVMTHQSFDADFYLASSKRRYDHSKSFLQNCPEFA